MEIATNVKTGDVKLSEPSGSQTAVVQPVVKEPDLITRVSAVKPEEIIKPTGTEVTEPEFDFKNIENIKDPVAKEQALAAYKSFQKGFNQKFQEIAEIRKTLETQKVQKVDDKWTPDRIQTLLQNPEFVQAAQSIIGNPTTTNTEDNSLLTDKEKQKLATLEVELQQMKQLNWQTIKAQQDTQLKTKYANYDAQAVDTLTSDMLSGKYQATREDLWRAYDYESGIKRAYELGKLDAKGVIKEKTQTTSIDGLTTVRADNQVQPEKDENSRDFFRRLFINNLEKTKTAEIRK